MMLKASLITDPKSLCIGAGTLLAQAGRGVAVAKFTTNDIESDSKACWTVVGTLVMRTERTDEAPGSSSSDPRYALTSASASSGLASSVARESRTVVGIAEIQAGVLVTEARSSRRASGLLSARATTEAGATARTAARSVWKAGLASMVVRKLDSSVLILDSCKGVLVGGTLRDRMGDLPLDSRCCSY